MATQVTVAMTFKDAEGNNESGTVEFRLTHPLLDSSGNLIATQSPSVATLASGAASIVLYATNDPTTTPNNLTYEVTEKITGSRTRRYEIELDYATTSVRLEDIAPVSTVPPVYSYATSAELNAITDDYVDKTGDTMTGALTLSGAPTNGLHAATKAYADTMLPLAGGTMTGALNFGSTTSTATTLSQSASRNFLDLPTSQSTFRWVYDSNPFTGSAETHYDNVAYLGWNIASGAGVISNSYGAVHIAFESDYWTNIGYDNAWHHQTEFHIQHTDRGGTGYNRRTFTSNFNEALQQTSTGIHADYFTVNEGGTGAGGSSPTTERTVLSWVPGGTFYIQKAATVFLDPDTTTPSTTLDVGYSSGGYSGAVSRLTLWSHLDGSGGVYLGNDADGSAWWRLYRNGDTNLVFYDAVNSRSQFQLTPSSNVNAVQTINQGNFVARALSTQATPALDVENSSQTMVWGVMSTGLMYMGDGNAPWIHAGSGSPEGAKTGPVGSVWLRTDGGAGTSIYVKESGTGNTGWVPK